jgi:pyridoxine 5'-phosphate synthase PdxJ
MNVVVIGLSHHSSPVELRERFAFAETKVPDALKSLRESGIASEAVILSTCNRVEIYAATPLESAKAFAELKNFLTKWGETAAEQVVGSSRCDDRTAQRAVPTDFPELQRLISGARQAHALGLKVNAGHGLNYENLPLLHRVPHLVELNIGHSIISRAVMVGLETAVKEMLRLMKNYRC